MITEQRPWGYYKVIEESENYKIKLIHVEPGQKLSYQRHKFRNEHWVILSGYSHITIDGIKRTYGPGSTITIPEGTLHRIEALSYPVEFIEVQTGTYFGEDDIERLEDDYGR
jgi:mannose-6-phosphate isomerase-like protein (cupin superfamily)